VVGSLGDWIVTLALELAGCALAAALVGLVGSRSRWIVLALTLIFLVLGCLLAVQLLPSAVPLAPHWVLGVGSIRPTRIAAGLLLGAIAALGLETLVAGDAAPSAPAQAVLLVLVGVAFCLLSSDSLVVVAIAAGALTGAVWLRWQRVMGPQLAVRSAARQSVLVFSSWLAAAAVVPGVRTGSSPPVLAAILIALALAGVIGVMPFSVWVGVAARMGRAEAVYWRLLFLPFGALLEARAIALSPVAVASPLRELLIGLGLATALFWGARALLGPDQGRYFRALACDSGLICVGVALGTVEGLAAALVLVVLHWLSGAVLSDQGGARPQLLAWIGLSGLPPFGGFTGRLLAVLAAVSFSPTLAALLLLVGGLQLGVAAAGMRSTLGTGRGRLSRGGELLGLLVALLTLLLGLVPVPAIHLLFGFRP
jgi:hypothetical protein